MVIRHTSIRDGRLHLVEIQPEGASFTMANIRAGAPLPPLICIGITKMVAPLAGTASRLAMFSRP